MKASVLGVLAVLVAASASAAEIPLASSVESAALFKNGLAVIRRRAEIGPSGVYVLSDVPSPVHGTFWIEGDVPVDAEVSMREVDAPETANIDFQKELVGRDVTIHFKENGIPAASGKVVALASAAGDAAWNRQYQQSPYYYYGGTPNSGESGRYLVLDSGHGRVFVDPTEMAFMECDDAGAVTHQKAPVLLLMPHGDKKGVIHISYLTKGIAWAPSYRINLTDDKTLTVEQQAVVKNELADLSDVEVTLISGYPSIRFAHVLSPLSPTQNWAQFFAEINGTPVDYNATANAAITQNNAPSNIASGGEGIELSAPPQDQGVDLRYRLIGKRTLGEGDSLMVSVANGSATYDRVVEWTVPDLRENVSRYDNNRDMAPAENDIWDAVRFKNPLPFAMTTGPAMVVDAGRFAGQQLSYWVDAGEETTLHVTKALSVRARADEEEDANAPRDVVKVGSFSYRKATITGTLSISNHRKQDISMVIRHLLSGELVKADGNPKVTLPDEGISFVNRRNTLTWTFAMKAGEEKTLTYHYTALVAD